MRVIFQFDVRDDEEQLVKLQDTMELLVAAGYFRARIKGLHPFDKVRCFLEFRRHSRAKVDR